MMRNASHDSHDKSGTRGAVYVEFLIAFLPVLIFFLCLVQLVLLFSYRLIVEHAATNCARAAAVVVGDLPKTYDESQSDINHLTDKRKSAVHDAALISLAPLILDGSVAGIDIVYPKADQPNGPDQTETPPVYPAMTYGGTTMMRVRLEVKVTCKIAFANRIACGGLFTAVDEVLFHNPTKVIRAEAIFPYQGARYEFTDE
jgi:hypothetical protein